MKRAGIVVLLIAVAAPAVYARIGGGDVVYKIKHIGNVTFSHETHVETMGFHCTDCHPFIFEAKEKHKTLQMSHRRQGMSCGYCHNGDKAFDLKTNCYVCHTKEVK
jgi:c(7)-type cytochrome triheme protein